MPLPPDLFIYPLELLHVAVFKQRHNLFCFAIFLSWLLPGWWEGAVWTVDCKHSSWNFRLSEKYSTLVIASFGFFQFNNIIYFLHLVIWPHLAAGYFKQWMQACLVISFAVGFLLFCIWQNKILWFLQTALLMCQKCRPEMWLFIYFLILGMNIYI
jgi:hypothetical protein